MAPESGRIPRSTKGSTSLASVDMTTRSHASTRLDPAPAAVPLTAPTTGLSQSSTDATSRCQPCCSIRAMSPGRLSAVGAGLAPVACGARAAPAQKCRAPAALSRTARTAGSLFALTNASVSVSRAKGGNEFPTSGRLMVMRWIPSPRTSTTMPDSCAAIYQTPVLTAFPLFGYLNFHHCEATTRRHRMAATGQITDEALARLRATIGIAVPHTQPPHYFRPNEDAFRHVAQSYGDANPLWSDPEYAAKSVWGESVAPPALVGGDTLIGEDEVTTLSDEERALTKGDPLRGVHAFYASSSREWWAPLRANRRVFRRNALVAALDKSSDFADRAIHEWSAQVFRDDEGTILGGQYRNMIRTERSKARGRKKYETVELKTWTSDEIAEIDERLAREAPRGADPRWWEDVDEGDEVG